MITAGLSLTDALNLLEIQFNPAMGRVIGEVRREVEGGKSLAEALSHYPKVFSKVYIASIKAGESAGVLDKILTRLANNLEKQREFMSKVKGAMIYPIIVVVGMIVVAGVMMIFVLPKMMTLYEEFNVELPITTKILMAASRFMASFWWLVLGLFFGLFYLFSPGPNFIKSWAWNYLKRPFFQVKMRILAFIRHLIVTLLFR